MPAPDSPTPRTPRNPRRSALLRIPRTGEPPAWLRGIFAGLFLYLFITAINIMGAGLKTIGKTEAGGEWIESVFSHANNPFIALLASVLVTAIVQSSSFTTSLIIAMVGTGTLGVESAVYAVMGANIGTSVTGIIVALGNMRIRRQFRKAFTAALMHDIFNLLTVALLFPLEWISALLNPTGGKGLLTVSAERIAAALGFEADAKPSNFLKMITQPLVDLAEGAVGLVVATGVTSGVLVAVIGLLLLFTSLVLMTKNLRGALLRKIETMFRAVFFRNDLLAYIIGTITTIMVQSSSVTTSLIVPLAGAGAVKLRRVFPFMLGANLGTTITGLIAATAISNDPGSEIDGRTLAMTVAIAHVLFNIVGTIIWYPLRLIPMSLARSYARLAAESKRYAFLFLFVVFIVIPLLGVLVTELFLPAPTAQ